MALNGISGTQAPNPVDQKNFQNEIKDKSLGDLAKTVGDQNAPQWKREEALKEMLKDLLTNKNNPLEDGEKSPLQDLLDQLTGKGKGKGDKGGTGGAGEKGDNSKAGDVLATVLQALGVPAEVAQGIGDMVGGGGEGKI
ncbi:hypothetical protein [Pseudoduganella namucuonensis]|uniref:Uncharacterized protein n=1 Tax=Pseudoduganella namucuonensis TaxID=1035707 RepID=A0A1I7L7Q6_9BURK|nr:hypothetical protein [Pseudoduganella namucuonensis]SFV05730.1 hypothetical protein SAMN05216552_102482 [Pseudoduganella namucuonensis]